MALLVEPNLGLHPKALGQAYCWSYSELFEFLYENRICRKWDTFWCWIKMGGYRNPRQEVLRKTYQAYQKLLKNGQEPLIPSAIALVSLEWY